MKRLGFVWENFGPMHADRCDAVAGEVSSHAEVIGLELFSTSKEYAWESETRKSFQKITLFENKSFATVPALKLARTIVRTCRKQGISDVFLCNYNEPGVFLAGLMLRALGRRVYVMGCSKFDDLDRRLWREIAKTAFFLPYQAAIASGKRSRDYMRLMGIREDRIFTEYNTLSIERIRHMAGNVPAPHGVAFPDRHFTIVARFVTKKNLFVALDAYRLYCEQSDRPRPLHLCGSGPLEAELREKAASIAGGRVVFTGFLQSGEIAGQLASTVTLLLPSVEEQFGNVVIEAQAMGLPVIVSDVCGARDNLVRSGKNGFVVEPDNPEGMAFLMKLLSEDEALWSRFSIEAGRSAELGDVRQFAKASAAIIAAAV